MKRKRLALHKETVKHLAAKTGLKAGVPETQLVNCWQTERPTITCMRVCS
jgi:hypothetical protein